MKESERRVITQLYKVIKELGGQSDLLGIIGSWGDTLTDEEVEAHLKFWLESQSD